MVARATEKDRDKRPGSARELVQLLEGAEFPVRLARSSNSQSRLTPPALLAARASLLGIPAAAMPEVVNLTLVRVQIAGWDCWAAATSAVFRALHLAAHDACVLPIVRSFGGRRIGSWEGGSVFAFRSPTDAVHCAAAIQDATSEGTEARDEVGRLELKIGVHQGEVHLDRRGASGAPLATVRALAETAAVGEVRLTRGVYLTMSRSEAPAEELGPRALAGLSEPVATYRLVRETGPRPYGGSHGTAPLATRRRRPAIAAAILSIQVAGETEGRLPAIGRVLWSGAGLLALGALEGAAGGMHAAVYRVHRALKPGRARPWPVDRVLFALERARRSAAAQATWLSVSLRRPQRRV